MDYAIIGGDDRFLHLARLLRRQGREAALLYRRDAPRELCAEPETLARARNVITNCPVRAGGPGLAEIAARTPVDARLLLCGPEVPESPPGRETANLWADEALVLENAWLTAEGAIAAAMRAGGFAVRGARCVVVGWGRIGRALTELLVGLGARVTVVSRSAVKRNRAVERGAEAVATEALVAALPGARIIFSTAPERVLDAAALARADRDALVIDLASPPYGVDLRAAWARGLRAWREPGLPGRYCPESAALALLDAIMREEERHG